MNISKIGNDRNHFSGHPEINSFFEFKINKQHKCAKSYINTSCLAVCPQVGTQKYTNAKIRE